jgi:hypothetical protein
VAKVLRRGVFERGAVATNELPSRLGRAILGRAFAATWGRLFFGYFLLAKQKKVSRQRRNRFACNLCNSRQYSNFQYSPPSMALTLRANAAHCSKTFQMFLSTFANYSLKLAIKPAK